MGTCEEKQHGNTRVSEEGEAGGVPGAGAKVPLQAVVQTMVKQLCPCSPWVHGGCRDPPTARGGGAHAGAGGCLEGAVIQWETRCREGPWLPGGSSLSLKDCTLWKSDPHCSSFGRTAACESGPTLEKFVENCLPWEGPHGAAGEGLLSLSSARKPQVMDWPNPPALSPCAVGGKE